MSWDYSGFLAEKIEAGRRLLASDPAFEGSEELQVSGQWRWVPSSARWAVFEQPPLKVTTTVRIRASVVAQDSAPSSLQRC